MLVFPFQGRLGTSVYAVFLCNVRCEGRLKSLETKNPKFLSGLERYTEQEVMNKILVLFTKPRKAITNNYFFFLPILLNFRIYNN